MYKEQLQYPDNENVSFFNTKHIWKRKYTEGTLIASSLVVHILKLLLNIELWGLFNTSCKVLEINAQHVLNQMHLTTLHAKKNSD